MDLLISCNGALYLRGYSTSIPLLLEDERPDCTKKDSFVTSQQMSCLISCGLNGSAQYLLGVHSQEFQSLRFFAGVDLDLALPCPTRIAHSWKGRFSWIGIVAARGGVFVGATLPRAVRIAEVDSHIRSYREVLVFGHLQSAISSQRASQMLLGAREIIQTQH